jgi:glycosyltransferase involved in cell wall biosynthesis
MRIVHFMRDRRPNVFSIERLYEDVRQALPSDCEAVEWMCRNPSVGFWPRLRDAWAARKAQGEVNHVTGDTHYLTYFLDRRRTLLTIHDLVCVERARGVRRFVLWFFWFLLPVMRSRRVITVSEATRQSLLTSVRCDPDKVVVIHNPVSEEFRPAAKSFDVACPRILQVGTNPNKNITRVAEALAGIRCKLIIIGPLYPELTAVLDKHGIDHENHVGLSREALLEQYIKADMLMFASTYEGFGLPIVEANAVGRPVVTSACSPMPEVAADAACLVDPHDVFSIRAGVKRIIEDELYRERLVAAGYRNALRFQPAAVAGNYAALYRQVAR